MTRAERLLLAVSCPACHGLDQDATTEPDALAAAGAHDDTHHGGAVTALITAPPPGRTRPAMPTATISRRIVQPVPAAVPGEEWTVAAVDLFDILTNTRPAAHDDLTLPALCTVRLHADGLRLHAVATDRYRIHQDHAALTTPLPFPSVGPPVGPVLLDRADVDRLLRELRPLIRRRDAGQVTLTVPPESGDGRLVTVDLPDWSTLRFHDTTDFRAGFLNIDRIEQGMRDWGPVDEIHVNPAFLADFARLVNGGRRISDALGLRFRTPRLNLNPSPIRITTPARPSFRADLMPIQLPDPAPAVTTRGRTS
jgi:hypothetical protein